MFVFLHWHNRSKIWKNVSTGPCAPPFPTPGTVAITLHINFCRKNVFRTGFSATARKWVNNPAVFPWTWEKWSDETVMPLRHSLRVPSSGSIWHCTNAGAVRCSLSWLCRLPYSHKPLLPQTAFHFHLWTAWFHIRHAYAGATRTGGIICGCIM